MNFSQRFTFLFSAPGFDADDLEGLRIHQIITATERLGFQVIRARRIEDAEIAVQTDAAIGCLVVDWGKKGLEGKTVAHQSYAPTRLGNADRAPRAAPKI
jgi:ornithine decarboxylase